MYPQSHFLCSEIYTVVRVDSSHRLRMKFICFMGGKRAFIKVILGICTRIVIYKSLKTKTSMVLKVPNFGLFSTVYNAFGGGRVHYSFFHGEESDSSHRGRMVFISFMGG